MSAKIKILLVDDDPDFVEINRTVLEADGYQIEEALTTKDAIEKIRNGDYDLLIIDLIMEELDSGFTIAYAVREDDRVKNTPILLLTSAQQKTGFTFHFPNDQEWMKVDDLAAKPLKPAELRRRVEKLLRREN
jgi:CheY-like chemotaxis protein